MPDFEILTILASMSGERINLAIQRIEAAIDRINTAEQSTSAQTVSDPEFARKHQNLREEVSQTLVELDQLIERLDQ